MCTYLNLIATSYIITLMQMGRHFDIMDIASMYEKLEQLLRGIHQGFGKQQNRANLGLITPLFQAFGLGGQ